MKEKLIALPENQTIHRPPRKSVGGERKPVGWVDEEIPLAIGAGTQEARRLSILYAA
jgi:hypothetical protein